MSALIFGTLGLLGLDTGLAILFFCNFNIIKASEKNLAALPRGQVAWFLWVAGVAELFASCYFFAVGDTLDAATFGGYGLFWMGLQALIYLGGDGRVLGPMALAYTVFTIPLIFAYATVSWTLTAVIVMLLLIFVSLIPAAWDKANAKLLGTLQVICFIIAAIAIIGLALGSMTGTPLVGIGKMLLALPS